jgi:hypothetical protein
MKAAEDTILENTMRGRKAAPGFFFSRRAIASRLRAANALDGKRKVRWDGGTARRGQEFSISNSFNTAAVAGNSGGKNGCGC